MSFRQEETTERAFSITVRDFDPTGGNGLYLREKVVGREKMCETRPVPRTESPWGTPEGEHRQPKPHRCNDRAEYLIQGNPFNTVPGPFKLFWQCMRSKPGEEPMEPFTYLELDLPKEK